MNHELCEYCGEPMECYEGEAYCPECSYYETLEHVRQADDEAFAAVQAVQSVEMDTTEDGTEPPF